MDTAVKNTRIEFSLRNGLNRSEIAQMAEHAVASVLEKGNVFEVSEALKAMEEFVGAVRKDERFVDYVREELQKFNGKITTPSGAKIEACEVGTSYDFSQCGDPLLSELEAKLEAAKDALKKRQDMLKTAPAKGMELLIEDEVVTVYPPAKKSTSSYKLTLAK